MLRNLLTGATGGLMASATGPNLQPLATALVMLLGGGLIAALVAVYKAKSEKSLNGVSEMEKLFQNQRLVNIDLIEQHDREVAVITERMQWLEEQLQISNGDRDRYRNDYTRLQKRLTECQRERVALRNQLKGLELTIDELKASRDTPPPRRRRRDTTGD